MTVQEFVSSGGNLCRSLLEGVQVRTINRKGSYFVRHPKILYKVSHALGELHSPPESIVGCIWSSTLEVDTSIYPVTLFWPESSLICSKIPSTSGNGLVA